MMMRRMALHHPGRDEKWLAAKPRSKEIDQLKTELFIEVKKKLSRAMIRKNLDVIIPGTSAVYENSIAADATDPSYSSSSSIR